MTNDLKRIGLPSQYPLGLPNCGIVAMSVATRRPYQDIWNWYQEHGHHSRRGTWKGETCSGDKPRALKAFGVLYERISVKESYTSYTKRCQNARDKDLKTPTYRKVTTIKLFIENIIERDTTYLCSVRGHAFCIRNGFLIDQTEGVKYYLLSRHLKRRLTDCIKIIEE